MYSECSGGVTLERGDILKHEQELESPDRKVQTFKRLLVNIFDDHCDSRLYTLKYHLLDHVVEDMRGLDY